MKDIWLKTGKKLEDWTSSEIAAAVSRKEKGVPILGFKRLSPSAILPKKATSGSACLDVYSAEDRAIDPGVTVVVSTGWHLIIPHGYRVDVKSRSGLAKEGVMIANSPGVIDEDYPGELKIILTRRMSMSMLPYKVKTGDRIAQISLEKVVEFEAVEFGDEASIPIGDRVGGLGSTGK